MKKLFIGAVVCFALLITVSVGYSECDGDVDCDGAVDGSDVAVLAQDFGRTDCPAKFGRMFGEIIMWGGEMDVTGKFPVVNGTIDERWHICDGTDYTPDLRDRFVIGAGYNYIIHEVGGNANLTLSLQQMPRHQHLPGTLSAEEADATHDHSHLDHVLKKVDTVQCAAGGIGWYNIDRYNENHSENRGGLHFTTEETATHSHDSLSGLTDYAGESQPVSILPPYYALVFLMYIGD